jgi:hypothetical protein
MNSSQPPAPDENVAPAPGFSRDLVHRCCEEVGLDPHRDADEVVDAIQCAPDRDCCDSGCDPCVLTIVRAASLVRQRHRAP